VSLKNVLSRDGLADPLIAEATIVPLDRIEVPEKDDLPPLKQLIGTAMVNRVDLQSDKLNLQNAETSALGTKNGVLPQLVALAGASSKGLAGTARIVQLRGSGFTPKPGQPLPAGIIPCPDVPGALCEVPGEAVVGDIGTALGQIIRRHYPSENASAYIVPSLRNRQAQADEGIDQLSLRQTELQDLRTVNQVAVDVSNQLIELQQARVRYQAAVKNRVLDEQLLQAEQKKFSLGASTTFLVVQAQSALATAQSTEVAALVAFSNARVSLDQTLGTTLKTNNISIDEARSGRVSRRSALPATLPQ
jgi:outer membrane protein TolC